MNPGPYIGRDHHHLSRTGWYRGDAHWGAKLSEEQVRQILALAGTRTTASIAQEFGVHQSTVSRIIRRRTWQHVAVNPNG